MALELYYTSVPRGLKPGSTGFCTVAYTIGMTAPMLQRLESLSGYRRIYQVAGPDAGKNPPEFAHWRPNIGGHYYSVLSHVCFVGADHQGRPSNFAHHLVVDTPEQAPAGPAWVMMQPGVVERRWTGEPRLLQVGKTIPNGSNSLRVCQAWAAMTGDAGWAGALVEAFLLDATRPAYILYSPGMDLLPLINEALALLPERARWRATFSTYFTALPTGLSCTWRCCVTGTPAAQAAPANATSGVLIDLTRPAGAPRNSRFVTMARTGQEVVDEPPPDAGRRLITAPAGRSQAGALENLSDLESDIHGLKDLEEPSRKPGAGGPPRRSPAGDAASWRQARRRRLVFWAVAVLWPVALLASGYFAFRGMLWSQPRILAPATEEQVADLQKKLDAADVWKQQLEKSKEQLKGKFETAAKDREQLAKDLADARKQLKDAELASADVGPRPNGPTDDPKNAPPIGVQKPTTSNAGPTATQPGHPLTQQGEAHYLPGYAVLSKDSLGRPEPPKEPYRAKLDRPGAARIEMCLPGATSPSPFQVEPGSQGKRIRVELARPPGSDGKPVPPLKVLEIALDGDVLRWEWLFKKEDLDFPVGGPYGKTVREAVAEIGKLLKYSVCVLSDDKGKPVQQVQFVAPEGPKTVSMNDKQSTKLDAPGDPCNPTWAETSVGDWKAEVKDGVLSMSHQKSKAGVRLELQNDKGIIHLSAKWAVGSSPAEIQKAISALETKIAAAEKAVAGADGEVAKRSRELKPLKEKLDALDKEVQKLRDDLGITALEENLVKLDAELKQAQKEVPQDSKHPTYEDKNKKVTELRDNIGKKEEEKGNKEKNPGLMAKKSERDNFKKDLSEYDRTKKHLDEAIREQKGQKDALTADREELAAAKVRLADTRGIGKLQFRVVAKGSGAILALVEVEVPKAGGQP